MYCGAQIAVVMPAYNVEDRIASAAAAVPDYVDQLVIVDDGSADRTLEVMNGLDRPGLVCLRHPENRGVGSAIATGYAEALRRGCQVVAVMAGDGQMDPSDLSAVIEPVARGQADYVKGNRFRLREVWRVMPKDRLLGSVVLSLLTKVTSGYWRLFDSQCGFTAISGRALRAIGVRFYARYGYPNDILARLRAVNARVTEVPVRALYDGQRSGIRPWTVFYPILYVLLGSMARRIWHQRLRPLLGPRAEMPQLTHADRSADHLLPAPPP